ncbi:extracellular solute-binding protein [Sphingomonas sp. KR1UV-12]|uniref:Extracellular solute-binding protein n=1 Tax=Sphingomonas aurea TaxID=3063994 RepID=A0ABT9EIZ9_9SPHN|nr:extracellular solute-binding protein [Sphingomonas sp. KR1UV-12]MDP1026935.1 extracellular solute-binding protein [Sphingomonas sp. KR1UV-12]
MGQAASPPDQGLTRRGLLAGSAALLASACAPRRNPAALRLWAMSYEGDYSPHLMPPFTRATGIDVEVQSLPWTASHEKLLTAFAGDAMPDVMMLPAGWVGEFAMVGAIAPVCDPALVTGLFPGLTEATRYGGRDHAVPWSVAPQAQFYRRDLLAAAGYDGPPLDWAGWRHMGRELKRRRPGEWVFLMPLNWWDALFTFAGQAGAKLLRDRNTRGDFASPEFAAALDFYASLYADRLAPPMLSTELQDPFAAFAQGAFAIYPRSPAMLLDLRRRAAEIAPDRWGVARMPGPRGPAPAGGISATLAVAATSPRAHEAWTLVRYMTGVGAELEFQRLIGSLPARQSAWAAPQMQAPVLRPFRSQMTELVTEPNVIEWERIRIEVQLVAERLVRGDLTSAQAMATMNTRADAILAKRRALVDAGRIA